MLFKFHYKWGTNIITTILYMVTKIQATKSIFFSFGFLMQFERDDRIRLLHNNIYYSDCKWMHENNVYQNSIFFFLNLQFFLKNKIIMMSISITFVFSGPMRSLRVWCVCRLYVYKRPAFSHSKTEKRIFELCQRDRQNPFIHRPLRTTSRNAKLDIILFVHCLLTTRVYSLFFRCIYA